MRLAIILNRQAGALAADPDGLAAGITERFTAAGHHARTELLAASAFIEAVRRAAADPDIDCVVVGGGDGSIGTGLNAVFGTGKRYGVLPGGTLNLFARDLGLPLDPVQAAEQLARGRTATIDVAEVNGYKFLNRASLGVHPWLLRHRNRQQSLRGRRKWWALARAALRAVSRQPRIEVALDCDGRQRRLRTFLLMVTNNPSSDSFGTLFHRDRLDTGVLALYVVKGSGWLRLLRLGLIAATGRWNDDMAVEYFTASSATVASRKPALQLAIDGEIVSMAPPLRYRIHPGSIEILVPGPEA